VFDAVFPEIREKLIKTAMESNIMNCVITFLQGTGCKTFINQQY